MAYEAGQEDDKQRYTISLSASATLEDWEWCGFCKVMDCHGIIKDC